MDWNTQAAPRLITAMEKAVGDQHVPLAAAAVDAAGTTAVSLPADLPADRRFEIGSVTKTLTAILLALLAEEGVLDLEDPIGRWLDAGGNASIRIDELATHTSGRPRIAPNVPVFGGTGANDPWDGYGFAQAEEGLRQSTRSTDGAAWRYSNLGYQLLALILERAANRSFAELVTDRLFVPLGMLDSRVGPASDGLLLAGRSGDGVDVPPARHPLGAGGVEATIGDLACYAQAVLRPPDSALGEAITRTLRPRLRVQDGVEQALGWIVREGGVREHSGGTAGFTACVSVSGSAGRAVALLAGCGGSPARASHFKQAAVLALSGRDPLLAAAPEAFPQWRERALGIGAGLLAGDFEGVHAGLAAPARARIAATDLARAWASRSREAGDPSGEVEIVRQEQAVSGAMVVDLAIGFTRSRLRLRTVVLPTGEFGGFTFLPDSA